MTRPLNEQEVQRILRARWELEKCLAACEKATRKRNEAIVAAFDARAHMTEAAQAAGIARKTVYSILKRAGRQL